MNQSTAIVHQLWISSKPIWFFNLYAVVIPYPWFLISTKKKKWLYTAPMASKTSF